MSYAKALEMLKAYEAGELISGYYQNGLGECCAIGAVVPATRSDNDGEFIRALADISPAVSMGLSAIGLTHDEAQELQNINDSIDGTREQRYAAVICWLEERVAEEAG